MYRWLIFSFTFCLFSMSRVEAKVPQSNKQFLKCIRKISLSRHLDKKSIEEVVELLRLYKQSDVEKLTKACEEMHESLTDKPKRHRLMILSEFKKFKSSKEKIFLSDFIEVKTKCNIMGVKASATAGVGIDAGIGIGRCLASNGRTWMVVNPTIGYNVGIGFMVGVVQQVVTLNSGKFPLEQDVAAVVVPGVGEIASHNGDEGVAIGLAINAGTDIDFILKLVPSGNDFRELNDKLLTLENGSLALTENY